MPTETTDGVSVRVWDWPVRVVHWAMAVLLVVLVTTANIGGNAMEWHIRAGETMLALVVFRVVWGFTGSRYARFGSFLRGPGAVSRYARSLSRPPHDLHVGHNPLGGWMVIALLVALLIQAGTGLFSNDDVLAEGPLVRFISKDLSDTISGFHIKNAWVVVGLASIHIAAVVYYLVALKENLIAPMLHGSKTVPATKVDGDEMPMQHAKAVALFAACAFAVWFVLMRH